MIGRTRGGSGEILGNLSGYILKNTTIRSSGESPELDIARDILQKILPRSIKQMATLALHGFRNRLGLAISKKLSFHFRARNRLGEID